MDKKLKFDEEIDESAIAIDFSQVTVKESIFYSISKNIIN